MLLLDVPPELVLGIVSYLPLQSIASFYLVSRRCRDLISNNESSVYHWAALLHHFIPSSRVQLAEVLIDHRGKLWDSVTSWKEFCRRRFHLERNWLGKGRSVIRTLHRAGNRVHRIKVDEKEQICITTHSHGGITVTQLFPDRTLWTLSSNYVREYAHCEYGNGFLVFDRIGNYKEVWRLASHFPPDEPDACAPDAPPDAFQQQAALNSSNRWGTSGRGVFKPWALLEMPEPTRAYRFVYPTLLTAGERHAYLHDVRTGARVQTIEHTVEMDDLLGVNYVELGARHVFVCANEELFVFARADGARVMTVTEDDAAEARLITSGDPPHLYDQVRSYTSDAVVAPVRLRPLDQRMSLVCGPRGGIMAVHVSEDGRDLVILCERECVILIENFERICRQECTFADIAVELRLGPGASLSTYLALEHGRVCVATTDKLLILHLDASAHGVKPPQRAPHLFRQPLPSFPRLAVHGVPPLDSHLAFVALSCVQLSDRRVFFTWNAAHRPPDLELYQDPDESPQPTTLALVPYSVPVNVGVGSVHVLEPAPIEPFERLNVGCIDFSIMPET
ncbi:hypothetical protein DENSPDRAFT_884770 [Dentipellis sp. KUC8613]|nr:hypothetical protein DENSPDRAFT_884770 [Dentipellis sp. KUC8613]